jgi:exonuclease SbcC
MILARFFQPKWQHPDPQTRRQALARLSPQNPDEHVLLRDLAERDPEPDVRRAAAKRVSDLGFLRRRMRDDEDAGVREVAAARYRQLLAGGAEAADLQLRLKELAACDDDAVRAYVARRGREPDLRLAAVERLQAAAVLEEIAVHDSVAKLRQAAVLRLAEPRSLERVMRRTRERDRKVCRIAREVLDRLQREREATERAHAERRAVCDALDRLAASGWPEGAEAERRRLENRWHAATAAPEPQLLQRFQDALRRCEASAAQPEIGASAPADEAAGAPIDREPPAAALQQDARPEPPAHATAAPVDADDGREQIAEQQAELRELLAALETSLAAGRLKESQRLSSRAQRMAERLPAGDRERLDRRLKLDAKRVRELQDWRRFAVLPKQIELCEQMEALVDAELPPPELAERIRRLQEAWKATGGSDSAEGQQLWERFRAAGDRAFGHCRGYFEEQAQRRQANLARRREIVEQLERFVAAAAWDRLDLPGLEAIRAQARDEWRAAVPVERREVRPLEARFEVLMEAVTARIRERRQDNREHKEALVVQARRLAAAEDVRAAVEQAKSLQVRWKALGSAQPNVERRLWREFRSACDEIFGRRDEARGHADRERQARVARAEALCVQAEALVADHAAELAEVEARLAALREECQRLPLPREQAGVLAQRLREAGRALDQQRRRQARQREQAMWAAAGARARLCEELERRALRHAGDEVAELTAQWQSLEPAPGPLQARLDARWQRALAAVDGSRPFVAAELAANLAVRWDLCLRMEILAGVESPPDDRTRRMDLQVRRLTAGMTAGRQTPAAQEAREVEADWLAAGPAAPADQATALARRFEVARKRAGGDG